jgi:hypothetical protein
MKDNEKKMINFDNQEIDLCKKLISIMAKDFKYYFKDVKLLTVVIVIQVRSDFINLYFCLHYLIMNLFY